MTTAPENRGGFRPTAPQNNPANVSATGGAGQKGTQAPKYIAGLGYGQGQATMQQQQGAPMAGPAPTPQAMPLNLPSVTEITAPTMYPNQPVTYGANAGPGPGMEVLNLPDPAQAQYQNARTAIESVASAPDASPMMKYLAQRVGQSF